MKNLRDVFIAALLTAAAAGTLRAAPRCSNGLPARLSGNAFAPVECSTTTKTAAQLPDQPVLPAKDAQTDLRDLDGRWEGSLAHTLGRYELLLTVKTGWTGKVVLTLNLKELQFHERLTDTLSLKPARERGAYEAVLTTVLAPEASLNGRALIGPAAAPKAPAERQMDLLFANGASHRLYFRLDGKDELRLLAYSAVPGGPLQTFETTLKRTKR